MDSGKLKLLIIDDSPFVLRAAAKALKNLEEVSIETAENVSEALKKFEGSFFHAVISDIILPDGTGLEILEKIRETSREIPVVMMTSDPSLDTVLKAIELGAFNYIVKPFKEDHFRNTAFQAANYYRLQLENRNYQANLEKLVEQRTEALHLANQKLLQEEELRRRLLTLAAHELRTPFTSLMGLIQVAQMGESTRDKVFPVLNKSSKRLHKLLNNILSQMEEKKGIIPIQCESFDTKELIEQIFEEFQPFFKSKKMEVKANIASVQAHSDPEKIRQVAMNLLLNALKYSMPGGTIKIIGQKVEGTDLYEILVSDNGPGILQEHLPHIFDKLTCFDDVNKYSSNNNFDLSYGLGMGLYIGKKFASVLNGQLECLTPPPIGVEGACFQFTFPVKYQANQDSNKAAANF